MGISVMLGSIIAGSGGFKQGRERVRMEGELDDKFVASGIYQDFHKANGKGVIMNKAVSFEYEWLTDETVRLRFLTQANDIMGQTIIDQKSLVTLQTLIAFAVARYTEVPASKLQSMFNYIGIEIDLSETEFMLEANRIRADTVPDGRLRMRVVEE